MEAAIPHIASPDRPDEYLQTREGRHSLPFQVEAVLGNYCIAIDRSTGGTVGTPLYTLAAPPSWVVREDRPADRFPEVKGAVHDLVSSLCTSGTKGMKQGTENQHEPPQETNCPTLRFPLEPYPLGGRVEI